VLDFPASAQALWAISDATGIRPEYLLPVLSSESGLRPDIPNQAGADYYGINQVSGDYLRKRGIDPKDYLTWPASRQLHEVVSAFAKSWVNYAKQFGVTIKSGTRVYQSNFWIESFKYGRTRLDDSLGVPANVYAANACLDKSAHFDKAQNTCVGGKGYITPRDLSKAVAGQVNAVAKELASTYALRPDEKPREPVFGEDKFFGATGGARTPSWLGPAVGGGIVVGFAVLLAMAIRREARRR
jgi:hypothetical protein